MLGVLDDLAWGWTFEDPALEDPALDYLALAYTKHRLFGACARVQKKSEKGVRRSEKEEKE